MGEPARARKLKGLRVLVAEDEALVAFQLEDMLAELGCAVIGPASRVGQALDLLGRERVDAAVLDVNVAGELVYPVADALTAQGLPYIFATGYGAAGLTPC
jgi:CheY-like chemotaxis protein